MLRSCSAPAALHELLRKHWHRLNAIHVVTALQGQAKLGVSSDDWLEAHDTSISSKDWLERTPDVPDDLQHLLHRLRDEVAEGSMDARAVSLAMWSLAKMRLVSPGDPLLIEIEQCSLVAMDKFGHQDLSHTLWGFATLGHTPSATWLRAMNTRALCTLKSHSFSPQSLGNFLWAGAKLRIQPSPALWAAIASELQTQASRIEAQHLANALWALAVHERRDCLDTLVILSDRARDLAPSLKPQDVANIVWAFATLEFDPGEHVIAELHHRAMHQICIFSVQELANLLWATASLGHALPGSHCIEYLHAIESRIQECNGQVVLNVLWAFAIMDPLVLQSAAHLWDSCVSLLESFTPEGLVQLTQASAVCTYMGESCSEDRQLDMYIPESIRADAWACVRAKKRNVSAMQKSVFSAIEDLGVSCTCEHPVLWGLLHADIVTEWSGKWVVVEVDGPSHYAWNSGRPLGATLLRNWLLTASGWTLATLPYWDWDGLGEEYPFDSDELREAQRTYVWAMLQHATGHELILQ